MDFLTRSERKIMVIFYSFICSTAKLTVPFNPLHTIGKVSVNASILYKNHEICNKTNM